MRIFAAIMALLAMLIPASVQAAPIAGLPDLIVDAGYAADTLRVQPAYYYGPESCSVQEGALTAGTHRLLLFGTQTANIGPVDLKVGPPKRSDPDNWAYYTCHSHWHFLRYAEYLLLDASGVIVGQGHKQSFCIEDVAPYTATADPRTHYYCNHQGISAGWSDIYGAGLDGQWVVIDDVPAGNYTLRITVNYAQVLPESDYSNNSVTVPVTIP